MDNKNEDSFNLKENVSNRINFLLKRDGMSQKALAEKSGLTTAVINKATKGELSVNSALLISKVFGVSLDYIFGNSDIDDKRQFVLDVLLKHIYMLSLKSVWGGDWINGCLTISKPLSQFFEAMNEAISAKTIPNDFRKDWINRVRRDFLNVIMDIPKEKQDFVLLDQNLYTNEVANAVEKAKEKLKNGRKEE